MVIATGGEGEKVNLKICLAGTRTSRVKGKSTDHYTKDTITYKSRLTPKKMAQKKRCYFLAFMGKTGLSHDIFFKFSVGPFEVVEVK